MLCFPFDSLIGSFSSPVGKASCQFCGLVGPLVCQVVLLASVTSEIVEFDRVRVEELDQLPIALADRSR